MVTVPACVAAPRVAQEVEVQRRTVSRILCLLPRLDLRPLLAARHQHQRMSLLHIAAVAAGLLHWWPQHAWPEFLGGPEHSTVKAPASGGPAASNRCRKRRVAPQKV